ncbi:MAG: energy-coupling factor transporter transmembrane protein EcfT, partial [Natronospirillum sp.]
MISLYLAQTSWLHRQPAGLKLFTMATVSIGLYFVGQPVWMLVALAVVLAVYGSLGLTAVKQLKLLRPLLWLFSIMFLVQWWTVGLAAGLTLVLRMSSLILLANLITLTTRMDAMMAAITPLLRPLGWVGADPRRIAFAVALLIRFVPVLMAVMHSLNEAWRARSGNLHRWRLAIPMAIQAIRLSDHVAEALASRGGIS